MTKPLRASALACVLAAGSASAQTAVSVRIGRTASPVLPVPSFSAPSGGATLVSPLSGLGLTPSLSAPSLAAPAPLAAPTVFAAQPRALAPSVHITAAPAATEAAAEASVVSQTPALSVLAAAAVADKTAVRLDAAFDGSAARAGEVAAVQAPLPAPARRSLFGRAALAGAALVAQPVLALAAAAPIVEPASLGIVVSYAPLATAIAAVLGALFGLWSSRSKDGSPANAGQVFAAALSHGAIAGAAAFALIDLTKVAFLGASAAALTPLTAAVATAALAQAAFAAKFMDPMTTPADRVMGAFPAVAMAFGFSLGAVALIAPAGPLALGAMALMATGAATALFTALFRLEKSAAAGPAAMGRGFVLQALMTGLALALGPSPYGLFFFALGLWGFALVMTATAKEVWAAVPQSLKDRFKPQLPR